MTANARRFGPTVNTELASPSCGPWVPLASATCWRVRPLVAGKSAAVTSWAARTFSRTPPAAGTCAVGSFESDEPQPPQPARSAAATSMTRGSLPIAASLIGRIVQAAPEVQAGARAVGAPGLGDRLHLRGLGRRPEAVCPHDRVAHPEVTRGQDVGPVQGEHEEHVGGPLPDALDRGELGDDLLVGELGEPVELQLAGQHVLGEGAQVGDLRAREPGGRSQLLGVVGEDLLRPRRAPVEALGQPPPDRARREHGELLARYRAHEGAVEVLRAATRVALERQRAAVAVDQRPQDRVGPAEVLVDQTWPSATAGTSGGST